LALKEIAKLTDGFELTGKIIITDNWFCTVRLSVHLTENEVGYITTMNKARILDSDIRRIKLAEIKNQPLFYQSLENENVLLTIFKCKKRIVYMISNCLKPDTSCLENYLASELVKTYNSLSHGTDTCNQRCSSYRCTHPNIKWPVKLLWAIMELWVNNVYTLNVTYNLKVTHKMFLINIIRSLLGEPKNNVMIHCPEFVGKLKKKQKRQKCTLCKSFTYWTCKLCSKMKNKNIYICIPKCYKTFHLINLYSY